MKKTSMTVQKQALIIFLQLQLPGVYERKKSVWGDVYQKNVKN